MKLSRYIAASLIALTAFTGAFADDFDDFGGFDGGDDFGFDGGSSSGIEVSGTFSVNVREYLDDVNNAEDMRNSKISSTPSSKVGIKYNDGKSGAELQLKVDESTIKDNPADVIDELVLNTEFGNLRLAAGKMKVVWGKGDKLHVIDNFNADDYSDYIIPDYIDRRISTPMARTVYVVPYSNSVLSNFTVEGVYTPFLPTDRFASDGCWKPTKVETLETTVTDAVSTNLGKKYVAAKMDSTKAADYLTYLSYASSLSADSLYPETDTLQYGQGGARVTATLGQIDLGLSYYYGHYKQPSVNLSKYIASTMQGAGLATNLTTYYELPELAYDQKQTFGLEFSTIFWKFNLRGEGAYNLTEDTAGDDPWVHNNSVQWLGGFDIDLPFWDANLNIQEYGTYILNNNKIDDLGTLKVYDVDYDSEGYTNNKLVVNFTTSFKNGKIAPEITTLYGFEHKDLSVMPKITYKPASSFKIIGRGLYIWASDEEKSEFGTWHKNSFAQLACEVAF